MANSIQRSSPSAAAPAARASRRRPALRYGPWPVLTTIPALVLYFLFHLYPSLGNVVFSFTDFRGNLSLFNWVGWLNYRQLLVLNPAELVNSLRVTLLYSLCTIVIGNVFGMLFAVLVNMPLRLRNVYRSILFLPSILGVIVVSLVWTLMFDPYSGPIGVLMRTLGVRTALLGDPNIALYLLMFVQVWAGIGGAMLVYLAGLQSIPNELYEAGRIDGADGWAAFRHITLPLLRPALTVNTILGIIGGLRTFDLILALTRGGPNKSTMTIGMYIFSTLSNGSSAGYTAAVSTVQFAVIFVLVLLAQWYLRRGEGDLT